MRANPGVLLLYYALLRRVKRNLVDARRICARIKTLNATITVKRNFTRLTIIDE